MAPAFVDAVMTYSTVFFLAYMFMVTIVYGSMLIAAVPELADQNKRVNSELRWRLNDSRFAPRVSFFLPAYNEGPVIEDAIRNFLTIEYPNIEIIVVNDGSKDETLDVLKNGFNLFPVPEPQDDAIVTKPLRQRYHSKNHPNLIVIDKENGGKADSLNAAMNRATGDYFLAMDADTLLDPDALQRLVRPFLYQEDLLAAGGTVRLVNGCTVENGRVMRAGVPNRWVVSTQIVEFLRGFLHGRIGLNRLGGNMIISGAFGLFDRKSCIDATGYLVGSVGEDMELVVRLTNERRAKKEGRWRIAYVPDAVAWTECPETLKILGSQRSRWHQGLHDVLSRHKNLFFNPKYGASGLFVFPFFVLIEFFGPVVQGLGILITVFAAIFGALSGTGALLIFLSAYGFGLVLSAGAIALDEFGYGAFGGPKDRYRMFRYTISESYFYQPLSVWWRLRGNYRHLKGGHSWGVMERSGFKKD